MKQRFLRLTALRFAAMAAAFGCMKLVIEEQGAAAWGDVVFLLSGLNLLVIPVLFGQENYLLAQKDTAVRLQSRQASANAAMVALAVSFGGGGLIYVLGPWQPWLRGLTWSLILLPLYAVARIVLRFHQKVGSAWVFGSLMGDSGFYLLFFAFLVFVDWPTGHPVQAIAAVLLAISLAGPLVLSVREGLLRGIRPFHATQFRRGAPFLLGGSLLLLMGWIDTFLLGAFLGSEEVGRYNVIFRIASIATIVLTLSNSVVSPRLRDLWVRDPTTFGTVVRMANRLNALSSGVLVALTLGFFPAIIGFWGLGPVEAEQLLIPGTVLLLGYFVNSLCGNVGYVLQMTGSVGRFNRFVAEAALINVLMNLTLIPAFGILGAAWATGASMVWWNVRAFHYSWTVMNIRLV